MFNFADAANGVSRCDSFPLAIWPNSHHMIRFLPARMRGITALELDRCVTDTEPMRKFIADAGKHLIIDLGIRLDQVRAERCFRGAQCPDMQIVHSSDA